MAKKREQEREQSHSKPQLFFEIDFMDKIDVYLYFVLIYKWKENLLKFWKSSKENADLKIMQKLLS